MESGYSINHSQNSDLGLGRYQKATFKAAVVSHSCILRVQTMHFQLVSLASLCYVLTMKARCAPKHMGNIYNEKCTTWELSQPFKLLSDTGIG